MTELFYDRIDDNELCPCGSNVVYSSCCMNRKDNKDYDADEFLNNDGKLNHFIISQLNNAKFKTCFHPNKDECTKDIKNAHALQNNGVLSLLSENGHIMIVKSGVNRQGLNIEIELNSKNKATTFTGFCGLHDTEVFKPIETIEYNPKSDEQNFLFSYRIYAYEYYKKLVAIELLKRLARNKPSIIQTNFYVNLYRNYQISKKDLLSNEVIFNNALIHNDYEIIKSIIIELPYRIPFASCFGYSPLFDLNKKPLGIEHIVNQDKNRLPMNFVTVLPQLNKSYIIYSYLKDDEAYFTNLISQINTKSEVEIKRYFNNLIPEYSENIVFNPSYWNKLSEYQKNDLISRIEGEFSNINMLDIDDMLGRKSNLEQRASYNLFRKFV